MVDAFVYKADIYCARCANMIKQGRDAVAWPSVMKEDSDYWPQGPYPNGGGEADSPQNCASCGTFLENPLTDDGDAWLREQCKPYEYPDTDGDVAPWSLIADRADDDGNRRWGSGFATTLHRDFEFNNGRGDLRQMKKIDTLMLATMVAGVALASAPAIAASYHHTFPFDAASHGASPPHGYIYADAAEARQAARGLPGCVRIKRVPDGYVTRPCLPSPPG